MVTYIHNKNERIKAETKIRKLIEEREYNQKLAALLEDEKKEQVKRKKTDDVLFFAFRNAILIASIWITWDIFMNGLRWTMR